MIQGMLWIIGTYGLSMIFVHIVHLWINRGNRHGNTAQHDAAQYDRGQHDGGQHDGGQHDAAKHKGLAHHHNAPKHYVLISNHNQLQIEWYIRSLLFFSWIKGKTIHITVIDEGSTDETIDIVHKLSLQCRVDIRVFHAAQGIETYRELLSGENTIIIKLNNHEDLHKIPLLQ